MTQSGGALFFSGRFAHILQPMPRYFFAIVYSRQEIADPIGTVLPDDAAAAEYACRLLAGLRAENPLGTPGPRLSALWSRSIPTQRRHGQSNAASLPAAVVRRERPNDSISRERQEANVGAAPAGMLERRALARRRNLRRPYDVQAWEG
jgi:hypothetical protein